MARIGIIGSGITGLTCARRLAQAGLSVTVFDKGKRVGGRLATRRGPDGVTFDHGAQFIRPQSQGFAELFEEMRRADVVSCWAIDEDRTCFVGVPEMIAIPAFLSDGLTIHQGCEVHGVHKTDKGWCLSLSDREALFDVLIVTVPAPQAARLLSSQAEICTALHRVEFVPCLTMMVSLNLKAPLHVNAFRPNEGSIAWAAQNSTKPGRSSGSSWVVQASPEWSKMHLELSKEDVATFLLPEFCALAEVGIESVAFSQGHRWRYSQTDKPLGQSHLKHHDGALYIGGDWCLGPNAEDGWKSGCAIADEILAL